MAWALGESFFRRDGDTLVVNILGKPSASKGAVGQRKGAQLEMRVTAQPYNWRATDPKALLTLLFGVRERDMKGRERVYAQLRIQDWRKWLTIFGPWYTPAQLGKCKDGQY